MQEHIKMLKAVIRCTELSAKEKILVIQKRLDIANPTKKSSKKLQDYVFDFLINHRGSFTRNQFVNGVLLFMPYNMHRTPAELEQLKVSILAGLPYRYNKTSEKMGLPIYIGEKYPGVYQNFKK